MSENEIDKIKPKKPKRTPRDFSDLYRITFSSIVDLDKEIIEFYAKNIKHGKALYLKECLLDGYEFIQKKLNSLPDEEKTQDKLFKILKKTEYIPDMFTKDKIRLISAVYTVLNKENEIKTNTVNNNEQLPIFVNDKIEKNENNPKENTDLGDKDWSHLKNLG